MHALGRLRTVTPGSNGGAVGRRPAATVESHWRIQLQVMRHRVTRLQALFRLLLKCAHHEEMGEGRRGERKRARKEEMKRSPDSMLVYRDTCAEV